MSKGRIAPAAPDVARLKQLQAKLKREGRLSPEEPAELMDGEFRRRRHDHDQRLAQRRRASRGQRAPLLQRPTGEHAALDITYAVFRAERERLLAELEFLRQQVTAAQHAQAEMRRLMLSVVAPKPPGGEGPGADQATLPEEERPVPGRRLWQRLRGAGSNRD